MYTCNHICMYCACVRACVRVCVCVCVFCPTVSSTFNFYKNGFLTPGRAIISTTLSKPGCVLNPRTPTSMLGGIDGTREYLYRDGTF